MLVASTHMEQAGGRIMMHAPRGCREGHRVQAGHVDGECCHAHEECSDFLGFDDLHRDKARQVCGISGGRTGSSYRLDHSRAQYARDSKHGRHGRGGRWGIMAAASPRGGMLMTVRSTPLLLTSRTAKPKRVACERGAPLMLCLHRENAQSMWLI